MLHYYLQRNVGQKEALALTFLEKYLVSMTFRDCPQKEEETYNCLLIFILQKTDNGLKISSLVLSYTFTYAIYIR